MSTSMLLLSLAPYSHSMSTFSDLSGRQAGSCLVINPEGSSRLRYSADLSGSLPVTGNVKVELTDVRGVPRDHDAPGELAWREPEGVVGDVVQLELGMNPAEESRACQNMSRGGRLTHIKGSLSPSAGA